jgi:predicted ATPase/DNA-binding SARP family transcriptional activator
MAGASAAIEFRVLGGVQALRNGAPLRLGGPRQHALLALLLVGDGRPVPSERLIDELWHGDPPAGAAGTLQSYVSRLRSALAVNGAIVGGASGYSLDAGVDNVDARRFERLVDEGQAALERGAPLRAVERFDAALALWSGSPFGGVGDEGVLHAEANRLADVHLRAREGRIAAKLEFGSSGELIDELESLVVEHPYRELLWHDLMLALYRAGRQADALATYRRARETLAGELGLEPSGELRQLEAAILRHEVPVANPAEARHNLPAPLTRFIGRDSELDEITALLAEARLVSLTGVGGVGKTRLAIAAAYRLVPDYGGGVYFVDLSVVSNPDLVPREIATALGVQSQPDVALRSEIAERLREEDLLIVLDNCEHVLEITASVSHELLAAAPGLRVLATSREVVGIEGEHNYPVPPLEPPDAVELFLARALAARPHLRLDAPAQAAATRICADVEGLPLAIELAAARANALSLEEIATRLGDRFRFLVSWRRLGPARHRTLREAMDWSYELLAADDQLLLTRLSVFARGFTLEAAAEICLDGDQGRALTLLERLVNASLIVIDDREEGMRYRLLETVRQYAAERVDDDGVADRHAAYYLARAENIAAAMQSTGLIRRFRELDPDDANLRASLELFARAGQLDSVLRLTAALWRWWWMRGELEEGRDWLALALESGFDHPSRIEALRGASTLALRQGDIASALSFAREAVTDAQAGSDPMVLARAQVALANAVSETADYERAEDLYRDAANGFRDKSRWELANALMNLGDLALNRGRLDEVERVAGESLELLRKTGDDAGIAVNLGNLAFAALERGDSRRATALLEEGLVLSRRVGFREWEAIMLVGLAAAATAQGEPVRAAQLLGASARVQDEIGVALGSFEARVHARTREDVEIALGAQDFAAAYAAGRELGPEAQPAPSI